MKWNFFLKREEKSLKQQHSQEIGKQSNKQKINKKKCICAALFNISIQ